MTTDDQLLDQQQAARLLGLSRQGLINKLKRYSLGA